MLCFTRMAGYFLRIRAFALFAGMALVAALLLSGCGGSSSVSAETGSLTRAQFVEKADQICKQSRAQLENEYAVAVKNAVQLAQATKSKPTPADLETLHSAVVDEVFVPVYETMIDEISTLGAPSADKEQLDKFLNAMHEAVEEASSDPSKPFENAHFLKPVTTAAARYGMTDCAALG